MPPPKAPPPSPPHPLPPAAAPPSPPFEDCYISRTAYEQLPAHDDPCRLGLTLNGELDKTALLHEDGACCQIMSYSSDLNSTQRQKKLDELTPFTEGVFIEGGAAELASFKDRRSERYGQLRFTVAPESLSQHDQMMFKTLTSTFVTGYMVYIHNANMGKSDPVKAVLKPVDGATMRQDVCLKHDGTSSACERATLEFTPGPTADGGLNANPFSSFVYTNPQRDAGSSPCSSSERSSVFNEDHAPLCGANAKLPTNQTEHVCSSARADGLSQPEFCISPTKVSGESYINRFLPRDHQEHFWNTEAAMALPSLFTTWELSLIHNEATDLSHVTKDDLFVNFFVQATKSFESKHDEPQCSFAKQAMLQAELESESAPYGAEGSASGEA